MILDKIGLDIGGAWRRCPQLSNKLKIQLVTANYIPIVTHQYHTATGNLRRHGIGLRFVIARIKHLPCRSFPKCGIVPCTYSLKNTSYPKKENLAVWDIARGAFLEIDDDSFAKHKPLRGGHTSFLPITYQVFRNILNSLCHQWKDSWISRLFHPIQTRKTLLNLPV